MRFPQSVVCGRAVCYFTSRISRRAAGCEMPRYEGDTAARRVAPAVVFSLFLPFLGAHHYRTGQNSPSSRKPKRWQIWLRCGKVRFPLREEIIAVHENSRKEFAGKNRCSRNFTFFRLLRARICFATLPYRPRAYFIRLIWGVCPIPRDGMPAR